MLLKKTDALKTSISWKENLKKCTIFEEQKGTRYIWGKICFIIIVFICLSSTNLCLRFLLICFAQERKHFYQSSLRNEVDFMDIMNISTIILSKNQNFKKLKHGFVEERVMITTTVTSSCQWKTLVPSFLLANDLRKRF